MTDFDACRKGFVTASRTLGAAIFVQAAAVLGAVALAAAFF